MNLVNLLGNVDAVAVDTTILDVLDAGLPADPYRREIFDPNVQALFDHVVAARPRLQHSQEGEVTAATKGAGVAALLVPYGNRRR